jgi:hypothetical protein
MKCLTDGLIQAIVDHEAPPDARAHASSCEACAARVLERQARSAAVMDAIDVPIPMPPALESRLRREMVTASGGASRLRSPSKSRSHRRRAFWSAGMVAMATLVVVIVVVPLFRGPATVSAAEILARSANQLAQTTTQGFELLEYELVLDGIPREMMPARAAGTYRMFQAIDHSTPGRFRYTSFTPDGKILTSIAQDPTSHTRVSLLRDDDQFYRFELTLPVDGFPSLPEIERMHMQATIAMMQASGQQILQLVDGADGPGYRIEVPRVSAANANAVWDLNEAQVVIDAKDFRITQLSASGTFLKQPYSMSYRLIRHVLSNSAPPDAFAVPSQSDEIVLTGEGSPNPVGDMFLSALREVGRARRAH